MKPGERSLLWIVLRLSIVLDALVIQGLITSDERTAIQAKSDAKGVGERFAIHTKGFKVRATYEDDL